MMNFVVNNDDFNAHVQAAAGGRLWCDFVLQMRDCVLKMRDFVSKMMNFAGFTKQLSHTEPFINPIYQSADCTCVAGSTCTGDGRNYTDGAEPPTPSRCRAFCQVSVERMCRKEQTRQNEWWLNY